MRKICTLLAGVFLASGASAAVPSVRATNHVGDVVCGYDAHDRTFNLSVGHGLKTNEIAVVRKERWNWLTAQPNSGISIQTGPGRTTIRILIDSVVPKTSIQAGGKAFGVSGDYSIRVGNNLDSEDTPDVVGCRYVVSR